MQKAFLYIVLLIALATPLQAYVTYHPANPTAALLERFPLSVSANGRQWHIEVEVWSVSSDTIDYVLDVESLAFDSGCEDAGSLTLQDLVETSADAALTEGMSRGYPACSSTPFSKTVRIWSASCAIRTGTGCSTAFDAGSGNMWSYRMYAVSCAGTGVPTITKKQGVACDCSNGYETSCPGENLE